MNNLQVTIVNQLCGMSALEAFEKTGKKRFYLSPRPEDGSPRYCLTEQTIDGDDFIKVWAETEDDYECCSDTTIGFIPIPRMWHYGDLANKIELLITA